MRDDFGIFIVSHARAEEVLDNTLKVLQRGRYTGQWWIVVDDEDPQLDLYKELWSKRLLIFSKKEMLDTIDLCDNFYEDRKTVLFARNKCYDLARELGLTYFAMLDDDLKAIHYRFVENGKLRGAHVTNLDELCDAVIKFLEVSGAKIVAFGQDGDFIGGAKGRFKQKVIRRAVNSFFCKVDRPVQFRGRIYEDTIANITLGMRGDLFFTILDVQTSQRAMGKLKGGMKEAYDYYSYYVAAFYNVMNAPGVAKVLVTHKDKRRFINSYAWDKYVVPILDEKYKR